MGVDQIPREPRHQEEPADVGAPLSNRDIAGLNDSTYIDRAPDEVTFYNVVFDEHLVFCANGLPVESFQPSAEALSHVTKTVRDELTRTVPDLAPKKFADYPSPRYKLRERVSYDPNFA